MCAFFCAFLVQESRAHCFAGQGKILNILALKVKFHRLAQPGYGFSSQRLTQDCSPSLRLCPGTTILTTEVSVKFKRSSFSLSFGLRAGAECMVMTWQSHLTWHVSLDQYTKTLMRANFSWTRMKTHRR